MPESCDFHELLKITRESAERMHVDMAAANRALDALCSAGEDLRSPFDRWRAIDDQIGDQSRNAEDQRVQELLIDLRTGFESALKTTRIDAIGQALKQSSDAGWSKWLESVAEAISWFRFRLAIGLCEAPFAFPETKNLDVENIRKAVSCMSQARWPEAYNVLNCPASAPMRQIGRVEEGRISGSS